MARKKDKQAQKDKKAAKDKKAQSAQRNPARAKETVAPATSPRPEDE